MSLGLPTLFDRALLARPRDVVALGAAKCEVILPVSDWPAAGLQSNVDVRSEPRISAGGCACTVACTVARLGGRAALVSAIGDGPAGQPVWAALARAGVDTSWVRRLAGHAGSQLFILTNPLGDWVVMQYNDPAICLAAERLPGPPALAEYKVLHIDGFAGADDRQKPIVASAIAAARAAGCLISIDAAVPVAGAQPAYVADLLAQSDIAYMNETEARLIAGAGTHAALIERLRGLGPRLCVLKLGAAGSWLIGAAGAAHVPAYQVEVVDTIAAGDSYIGALLQGLCAGLPLRAAARRASAAGALACRGAGSLSADFSPDELEQLLASDAGEEHV